MIDLDELDRLLQACFTEGCVSDNAAPVVEAEHRLQAALRSAARYLIDEAREAARLRTVVETMRAINLDDTVTFKQATKIPQELLEIRIAIDDCRLDITMTAAEIIAEWREVAKIHGTVVEAPTDA